MQTYIIVFVIIFVIIVVFKKSMKSKSEDNNLVQSNVEDDLLYKNKGIKVFNIVGTYYQNLNPKKHSGNFIGYANCDYNSHDAYAVGIYNDKNVLLGFTPKGNRRLNNSLQKWHKGKIFAWGYLYYEEYNGKWEGKINIPIEFSDLEIDKIINVLANIKKMEQKLELKEKSTTFYFEILDLHKEIKTILGDLKNPEAIFYSFPKNLLPSISSHLEKNKEWAKIVELEKYGDLILDLSEKYSVTTLKRIENAKLKLNN